MSAGPPRGMRQSMNARCCMNSTAASCDVSSSSTTASAGRPALATASRSTDAIADVRRDRAGRAAQERGVARLQAQPGGVAGDVGPVLVDDRHHTERHTHPLIRRPFGRTHPSRTSPTGSASAGDLAQPTGHRLDPVGGQAQPVDDGGGSRSSPRPVATSAALASRISSPRATSRSAAPSSASFLAAVDAVASTRDAALARRPARESARVPGRRSHDGQGYLPR